MPSFAELREKASRAKDAGVTRLSNTKNKFQSTSSKDMEWDPNHKRALPPSVPRSSASHSRGPSNVSEDSSPSPPNLATSSRPPPIIPRGTRPNVPSHTKPQPPTRHTVSGVEQINWMNLSPEDKHAFFSCLDEFFSKYLNITIPPRDPPVGNVAQIPATSARSPPITSRNRLAQPLVPPILCEDALSLSYPPPNIHGSLAQDVAHYFLPATHWDSAWYASDSPVAPVFQTTPPSGSMSSWSSHGPNKTVLGAGLFSDLSFCWYSVKFSISSRTDPNDTRAVTRSAQYLPPPKALDRDALLLAHETYGDTVAAFAESFEGTDQYCARGECWDLASEALKYFDEFDYIPKPLPSTSCTHGHLIFSGKASSSSQQVGFWRGGDDRIRRGDILQWKNGKIGMGPRGHATLGNPDHTAVIVTDSVPLAPVADGASVEPSVLGIIEVVEQSVGSPPKREKYDLSQLQVGELWIYRPIGIVTYLGTTLEIECPPHVGAMSI